MVESYEHLKGSAMDAQQHPINNLNNQSIQMPVYHPPYPDKGEEYTNITKTKAAE